MNYTEFAVKTYLTKCGTTTGRQTHWYRYSCNNSTFESQLSKIFVIKVIIFEDIVDSRLL
jgi:hypothetical protein